MRSCRIHHVFHLEDKNSRLTMSSRQHCSLRVFFWICLACTILLVPRSTWSCADATCDWRRYDVFFCNIGLLERQKRSIGRSQLASVGDAYMGQYNRYSRNNWRMYAIRSCLQGHIVQHLMGLAAHSQRHSVLLRNGLGKGL